MSAITKQSHFFTRKNVEQTRVHSFSTPRARYNRARIYLVSKESIFNARLKFRIPEAQACFRGRSGKPDSAPNSSVCSRLSPKTTRGINLKRCSLPIFPICLLFLLKRHHSPPGRDRHQLTTVAVNTRTSLATGDRALSPF